MIKDFWTEDEMEMAEDEYNKFKQTIVIERLK